MVFKCVNKFFIVKCDNYLFYNSFTNKIKNNYFFISLKICATLLEIPAKESKWNSVLYIYRLNIIDKKTATTDI